MGLDVGEALPLARLSPITRTISLTDTPCNSGGKCLIKPNMAYLHWHFQRNKFMINEANLERGGGLGASFTTDPSRRNQF